jgi:predicted DNA-binding transcriptional regulator YafY
MYELAERIGVNSITTIKNFFGSKDGSSDGIRHGQFWPNSMLDKFDPDKDEIIIEERYGRKLKYRFIEGFTLFDDDLPNNVIESILPFLEHTNQIHGLDIAFSKTIDTMLEIIKKQKKGKYKQECEKIINTEKTMKLSLQEVFNSGITLEKQIPILRNSISNKLPIEIEYKSFKGKKSTSIAHPYLLVESNSRWYIICFLETLIEGDFEEDRIGKINTLAIDRIKNVRMNNKSEFLSCSIDILERLDRTIGVSILNWEDPLTYELEIEVSDFLVKYFESKPLIIELQKQKGNKFIYPDTIETVELIAKLRSFGSSLKVLSPSSLVEKIQRDLTKSVNINMMAANNIELGYGKINQNN